MKPSRFNIPVAVLAVSLAMAIANASAETKSYGKTPEERSGNRDSTPMNQPDSPLTPMDQSNDKRDIDLTSKVRKAITQDQSLSVSGHNVKVISSAGKVTLRGPVDSAQERSKVMATVQKVAGVNSVDNQLEIAKN